MARIRTIKPEFFASEDVAVIKNCAARLTFLGLLTQVDDEGRMVENTRRLKGALWSLDDDITHHDVAEHLADLAAQRLIIRYRGVDKGTERDLIQVTKWRQHQRINRPTPSKLPPPDDWPEYEG